MRTASGLRSRRFAALIVFVGLVPIAGCDDGGLLPLPVGGTAPVGAPCAAATTCAGRLCLTYPGGYCSQPCGTANCPAGTVCLARAGGSACHTSCTGVSECRMGYQCFSGGCVPACTTDEECGATYTCAAGTCMVRPGKLQGEPCGADADCSSRHCELSSNTCEIPCTREEDCPGSQTCFYNPVDSDANGSLDKPNPLCRPLRAGRSASGTSCVSDDGCERGQCQYGVCTVLCVPGGTCAAPLRCEGAFAALEGGPAPLRQCLPARGVLEMPLGDELGAVGLPAHAVSLGLWAEHVTQDFAYLTGFTTISDEAAEVYSFPVDLYKNPLRYRPSEGASYVYISNSGEVPFKPGSIYSYVPFSQTRSGLLGKYTVRARVRVSDHGIAYGHFPVRVFITDLTGGCYKGTLNAANAHQVLGTFEQRFAQVFAQANITIDSWTYTDSKAPSTIDVLANSTSPDLANLLRTATAGDNLDTVELVLIRKINDLGAQPGLEILGIAGGVPASGGIPGTVHSGAAVSLSSLCLNGGQVSLALVAAHESGHALGLFHTAESDKVHFDQFLDNDNDGPANLMYWAEGSSTGKLSPSQSAILVRNPQVKE